ncbi:MAG: ATPase [Oscillatoriales cyanobacterium RU_3_3]|nr:ATPase [Oscillatoriales cyanobacterium RU_3_3]NJR22917.1 ATPase [Richelia sp. CSU_2_1]
MSYVLGIDGGGTKTVCVLMNENQQVLGRGEAGPSNYQTLGIEATKQSIQQAIDRSILSANIDVRRDFKIEAICLGLAGVGRPKDIEIVQSLAKNLQFTKNLPADRSPQFQNRQTPNTIICSDSTLALVGGIGYPIGIAVIAGTGSIVCGQNSQGKTKRVGGWGYLLGDEGSGCNIAMRGLQAALKFHDGRGEFTTLAAKFQKHLCLNSLEELVEIVYRSGWGVKEIAALAPIVDRAAAEGDRIADAIINSAVAELTLATKTAISALFDRTAEFEIVIIGGVWNGEANCRDRFASAMVAIAPNATVILPRHEPAFGAGLLALNAAK